LYKDNKQGEINQDAKMSYFAKSLILRARMTFKNGLSFDRSGLTEIADFGVKRSQDEFSIHNLEKE